MRRLLAFVFLTAVSCSPSPGRLLGFSSTVTPQTSPGLFWVTWGASTATCNNRPCVLLDGGSSTYASDPIVAGGLSGVAESGAMFVCSSPNSAPSQDYVTAGIGNDGTLFVPAAATNSAMIDGGYGDSGTPGVIVVVTQPSNYIEITLTHLAAQTLDGGNLDAGYFCDAGFSDNFCDAGPQGVSIIGECDGGAYSFYVDSGVNFCDGGNFCDAGPALYYGPATCFASYDDAGTNFCDGGNFCDAGPAAPYQKVYGQSTAAVALSCNVNTVPR